MDYPHKHSGPVIVAGNALCLHEDLALARETYPSAPVIAVNGASRETKAFALYSKHPERFLMLGWIRNQIRLFGDDFTVHGGKLALSNTHVDYWWPLAYGVGGSAWDARKMASMMGFDLVILCGCPMVPGPYVGNHNIGGFMHRDDVVLGFQKDIECDTNWHKGAVSMSGFTREILGGLDDSMRSSPIR